MPRFVTLVSASKEQANRLREVTRGLDRDAWCFAVQADASEPPADGICIFDYSPSIAIPDWYRTRPGLRVLFMVGRRHLDALLAAIPVVESNVLLKPVPSAVLQAYLSLATRTYDQIGSLRADRDEILQCLFHANLRLQEYDRQRTDFLARVAHDFRSPLSAVAGMCEFLADGHLGELTAAQNAAVTRTQSTVRRLLRMSSALLELSTAGQKEGSADLREGDILACVGQAIEEVRMVRSDRNISIAIGEFTPPSGNVLFEPERIVQVLVNLLENAEKATPRGGSITVEAKPYFWERRSPAGRGPNDERRRNQIAAPNSYRIDVCDTGPGIPAEWRDEIFEEYSSGSGERARAGLGLAICRLILRQHHGAIWAESNGQGAVFSFVLPYRATAEAYRATAEAYQATAEAYQATAEAYQATAEAYQATAEAGRRAPQQQPGETAAFEVTRSA